MEIVELRSEAELREAFPVVRELDERRYVELLSEVVPSGYHMFAVRDKGEVAVVAGIPSAVLVAPRHRSSKGDAMTTKPDLPIISFASRKAWEAWLEEQHATSTGLWLKIAKKGSGIESVSYAEALEAALCYGWIDGQKGSFDENYWLQRFTPRKPRSKWSKVNRQKATELIERGEMKPAGLREVERAKADGRWDAAYDAQSTATVPDDLRRELEKNELARVFFSNLDSRNRYAILYQIQDAKRPETRARRIAKYVAMLNEQKKLYP